MSQNSYRARALAQIQAHRRQAQEQAKQRYQAAVASSEVLSRLSVELSRNALQTAQAAMSANAQKLGDLRKENAALLQKFDAALAKAGYTRKDFEPVYHCPACVDNGYFNGMVCTCLRDLEKKLAVETLSDRFPLQTCTFDAFCVDYYPKDVRAKMQKHFDFCRRYAEPFERRGYGILMCGETGLGKTHLSLAIAGKVMQQGYTVVYGSVGNLLARVEREHFSNGGSLDSMETLLSCDLLILDDLGTEFSSAFLNSALYNIINSRILSEKPTIISTNLSLQELGSRYSDRIVSRIVGSYELLQFEGRDIRILKKTGIPE